MVELLKKILKNASTAKLVLTVDITNNNAVSYVLLVEDSEYVLTKEEYSELSASLKK